jgi:hypothetical protein
LTATARFLLTFTSARCATAVSFNHSKSLPRRGLSVRPYKNSIASAYARLLDTVVQVDLGKCPMKLKFPIVVVILTIFYALGEKGHAYELNLVPRNRTELMTIKSTGLASDGTTITASLRIECIYRVTLDQHFRLNMSGGLQHCPQPHEPRRRPGDRQRHGPALRGSRW